MLQNLIKNLWLTVDREKVGGELAAKEIIRLMNPVEFIREAGADTAPHWRIRHGAYDRDSRSANPGEVLNEHKKQKQVQDKKKPRRKRIQVLPDFRLNRKLTWMIRWMIPAR